MKTQSHTGEDMVTQAEVNVSTGQRLLTPQERGASRRNHCNSLTFVSGPRAVGGDRPVTSSTLPAFVTLGQQPGRPRHRIQGQSAFPEPQRPAHLDVARPPIRPQPRSHKACTQQVAQALALRSDLIPAWPSRDAAVSGQIAHDSFPPGLEASSSTTSLGSLPRLSGPQHHHLAPQLSLIWPSPPFPTLLARTASAQRVSALCGPTRHPHTCLTILISGCLL